MIQRPDLAALTPAQRANVIYAQAQSELSNRLWRAAIGDGERDPNKSGMPLGGAGMSMDSLLEMLGTQVPQTARGKCNCRCDCDCHRGGEDREGEPGMIAKALGAAPAPAAASSRPSPPSFETNATGDNTPLALGPNARYHATLAEAGARSGIPASAIAAIIDAEAAKGGDGSWNPLSRNPRSSAAGLGQFLSGTWQTLAEQPGTWLNQVAQQRGWLTGSGKVDPARRGEVLALRYDPQASIMSVADMACSNLRQLESAGLKVRADSETLAKAAYLGHHLGLADARRFLAGEIAPARARQLLAAQIGGAAADQRIASAGDAKSAHREWLLGFIDRRIQPEKFSL